MQEAFKDATAFKPTNLSTWSFGAMGADGLEDAFNGCSKFTGEGVSDWNLQGVTSLKGTFAHTTSSFSVDLSPMNVLGISNLAHTFQGATGSINGVDAWTLNGNGVNASFMFAETTVFNGNLSSWNSAYLNDVRGMFKDASAFTGIGVESWKSWTLCTSFAHTFSGAVNFNGDVKHWDVSHVTEFDEMFRGATSFNGNMTLWQTGSATSFSNMFNGAAEFTGSIGDWNTVNCKNFEGMLRNAVAYNEDLRAWDTRSATTFSGMFESAAKFNGNLSGWNVENVENFSDMFKLHDSLLVMGLEAGILLRARTFEACLPMHLPCRSLI